MGPELALIACLAGLAVFILWESWQRRKPTPLQRRTLERGYVPGESNRELIWFTVALVSAVSGAALLELQPTPPFNGRGAALLEFIHARFGSIAFPVLLWLAAAGALIAGVRARVRRRRTGGSADAS